MLKNIKNRKSTEIFTLFLALIMIFMSIFGLTSCQNNGTEQSGETETEKGNNEYENGYSFDADIAEYIRYLDPKDSKYLLLVNKENPLGTYYIPSDLVTLDSSITRKEIKLERYAAMALTAMIAEMRADGIDDVYVTSGYREYSYQQSLWYTYIDNESKAHPDWTMAQVQEEVLTYSAKPGTSEHQSGLCADLICESMNSVLDNTFESTDAFAWLQKNAYKFGFILRYPKDKVSVTGYSYESWHYRFVGQKAAYEIYRNQLCLEEYLGR